MKMVNKILDKSTEKLGLGLFTIGLNYFCINLQNYRQFRWKNKSTFNNISVNVFTDITTT
jgi:hypothetical protein